MIYSYHYSKNNEIKYDKFLCELDNKFQGQRIPWANRGGAIDLVTAFDVAMQWGPTAIAVKMIGGKYIDGLFNTDAVKAAGVRHRKKLIALSQSAAEEIRTLCQKLGCMVAQGLDDFFRGKGLAVTLSLSIEDISVYIVVNQEGVDGDALNLIPEAIDRIFELKLGGAIPKDVHTSQLFYDLEARSWRYLFIPTNEGFGSHVDRIISLETSDIVLVKDNNDFIERFHPSPKDQLKFVISPFRNNGFLND